MRIVPRKIIVTVLLSSAVCFALYYLSHVNSELTLEDKHTIESLGLSKDCSTLSDFDQEIHCIRAVQNFYQNWFPTTKSPPIKTLRVPHEPAIILAQKWGACYDRARLIEKTLEYFGFHTRHVSAHHLRVPFPWGYLFSTNSHAFSETLTKKGWMSVGSLTSFIGITKNGEILNTFQLREILKNSEKRAQLEQQPSHDYFNGDFYFIYGLYSRHGMFFPPFVPIPDIDWGQIHYNF